MIDYARLLDAPCDSLTRPRTIPCWVYVDWVALVDVETRQVP